MNSIKQVKIYTDGSCSKNPNCPGGYAAIILNDEKTIVYGHSLNTTNNRMELAAVIEGLKRLDESCSVDIYSDSKYIVNAFNECWLDNWIKNGWRTSSGSDVKNKDLWRILVDITNKHVVRFHWVKGHSDNDLNNECDNLARSHSCQYNPLYEL